VRIVRGAGAPSPALAELLELSAVLSPAAIAAAVC
jgi:hypothetical protein